MRKEKNLLLEELQSEIEASPALLVASYDKLEPNISWQLRELLAKSKSRFEVVKKRVFLKAAEKAKLKIDAAQLKGHVGIVFIEQTDAIASAKTVFKFSEENGNLLAVLCGQIDGKIVPGAEVEMLSKLPGLDEMRAQLIALLVSPMSHTLSVMEAAMAGPLSILENKSES